jgi:hypothetical protein
MSPRRACILAIYAAIALALAAGCAREPGGRATANGTPASADTLSNGVPLALARESAPWVAMWRKADPGFTPDSLIPSGRGPASLGGSVRPLDDSIVSDTDSSIVRDVMGAISPTGRYVLVADAYRALPDSEVQNEAGGEADEAAVLIDYQRRTCDMFLVLGTPYTFDWGGWVDSTHFALAGSESDDERSCFGFISLYSISENSVTTWKTRTTALATREVYYAASQERLREGCRAWKAARTRHRR